jgi:hypothetical protein
MVEIIEAIQKKLSENGNFNYVDENWGQLDYYSPNFPVQWPCVLIDVAGATFSNIGKDHSKAPINRQMGDITIELRIANLRLTNTSGKAPNLQKIYTRSIWQLLEELHRELHGWNATAASSKLIRTTVNRVRRDDGVQEYAVRYSAEVNGC